MANPTTNFGWQMPTATDLVTDLPADFEVFGQAVDTDFVDLLGGTTGQVLSKTSATDLAFTWIDSDDTNAIQNAIMDAKGDLIAATAADTPSRLAVGANDTVLTADSAEATGMKWATPAGSALVGCALSLSSAVSLSNGSGVIINWDTELFDTDDFHSTVTNTSRLTVPAGKGGKYLVGCMGRFAANATGYRNTTIRLNGATSINGSSGASVGASGSAQTVNIFLRTFTAGDYLEVDAYQNSGGNLNFESTDANSTFYMYFLGA
jgi:hypothetical protein